MNIQEQFNKVAEEYDKNRRFFIPCFDDFYITTTDIITSQISSPGKILDLGSGTGLLANFWFSIFPKAQYYLVDVASDMLVVAKKRFAGLDNIHYQVKDYTNNLPNETFDVIMSALSIHHLENEKKQELFTKVWENLPDGGIFVNYDQFCANSKELNDWYSSFWENQLYESELSEYDIELWKERKKLDKECSTEHEIELLKKSGFKNVECIYSYHKFSVLVAVKH